jgi:multisubunit Na+/H+ antiporter MnhG subunit
MNSQNPSSTTLGVWITAAAILLWMAQQPGFLLQLGAAWLLFALIAGPLLTVAMVLALTAEGLERAMQWAEQQCTAAVAAMRRQAAWLDWHRWVAGSRPNPAH